MLKPTRSLEDFENRLVASTPADFHRNLQIVQWLYEHAVRLGAFPPKDPLEGLDVDIRIAKAVNRVSRPSGEPRQGPG